MVRKPSPTLKKVLDSAARLREVVPDAVLVGGSAAALHAGLRQMRRTRPLATCEVNLDSGAVVVAPTADEALRIKAYLVVQRNVVRAYLDVVALADHLGTEHAVAILQGIDDYYDDRSGEHGSVLTSVVLALADPAPRDPAVTAELPRYKGLDKRWHHWADVVAACQDLSLRLSGAA
jgi:hypothetical protein